MLFVRLSCLFILSVVTIGGSYSKPPQKLPIIEWEEEGRGALARIPHDLDGNGKTDVELIYTIREKFFVDVPPESLVKFYPSMILLTVPFEVGSMIYVVGRHPLYYWYDTNEDGECDVILHDPTESGFQYESTR